MLMMFLGRKRISKLNFVIAERTILIDDYADALQICEELLYFLSCKSTFILNNMLLLIHSYLAIRKAL
jgi:hypothetical protein